jgi:ubiquinone/menaquinone biosynthesis C-methylase UbiE
VDFSLKQDELRWLWEHPRERHENHLAMRQAATTLLTGGADSTEEWALIHISAALHNSEVYRQRPFLLDAGCGPGHYLAALLADPAVPEGLAVGLDRSRDALLKAQARLKDIAGAALVQGDILHLPFEPASFGAAMCNRMLNQTGDIAGALAAVAAVLAPGGSIFIVTADSGDVSPLRAAHERYQAALGFPARLYHHTTRPGQRFNLENGAEWLAPAYTASRVKLYARHLKFTGLAELGKYYASGLLFQKSSGLAEPEIRPEQWLALYSGVMHEMAEIIASTGYLAYQEGAALFSAQRN